MYGFMFVLKVPDPPNTEPSSSGDPPPAPFHLNIWSCGAGVYCCCCIGGIGIGTMGDAPGAARFREPGDDGVGYIRPGRSAAMCGER